jgi:hypothetical protein
MVIPNFIKIRPLVRKLYGETYGQSHYKKGIRLKVDQVIGHGYGAYIFEFKASKSPAMEMCEPQVMGDSGPAHLLQAAASERHLGSASGRLPQGRHTETFTMGQHNAINLWVSGLISDAGVRGIESDFGHNFYYLQMEIPQIIIIIIIIIINYHHLYWEITKFGGAQITKPLM